MTGRREFIKAGAALSLLSGLRDDKHDLQNQINGLTDEKNALNEKLSAAGEFDAQMSSRILRDALTGKSVVVFRTPDAADDDVDAPRRTELPARVDSRPARHRAHVAGAARWGGPLGWARCAPSWWPSAPSTARLPMCPPTISARQPSRRRSHAPSKRSSTIRRRAVP